MERTLNIIRRAYEDFDLQINMEDSMQDIFDQAYNLIMDGDVDYISEGETNKHYDALYWEDGKGYHIEVSGELISSDYKKNTFYRKDDFGNFVEVPWYEQKDDDYVFMMYDIDTDGKKVAIICK